MRVVLRVRKKGIVILTKDIRRKAGIDEGDELIVEVEEGKLTMKVLRPKVVDVDLNLVEELLREEYRLERRKYGETLHE